MKYLTKYNSKVVDTSKLEKGMVFTSYKAICEALGEEPTNSHSRIVQAQNWSRFFEFTHYGRRYEIVEIYDEPLDIQIDSLRQSLFVSNGAYLIMDFLEKEIPKDNKDNLQFIRLTRVQLLQVLNLIDNIYVNNDRDRKGFKRWLNRFDIPFTDEQVNTAFNLCNDRLYSILNAILKAVRKYSLVKWDKVYMIKKTAEGDYEEELAETFIDPETGEKRQNCIDSIKIEMAQQDALDYLVENNKIALPNVTEVAKKRLFSELYRIINDILFADYGWRGCFKVYKLTPLYGKSWDKVKTMFKEDAEVYRERIRASFYDKVKEKCGDIENEKDREMVNMLIDYLLSRPIMTSKELQQAYSQRIDKIAEYKTASDEKEKESIMQSFTDMCRPEPIPTPTPTTTMNNDGYTQSDYSDIPDDWEQIYESLEREDRECEAAMRKLEGQEQSKHKPVNTEMFTAMFGAQGDAHTQENAQGNVQAVDISNLLDFSEEKCESESTDSAYASVQFGERAHRGYDYSWNDVDVIYRPDRRVSEFEEWDIRSMVDSI